MTTINDYVRSWGETIGDQDISPSYLGNLLYTTGAKGFSQLSATGAVWIKNAVVGTTKTVCDLACQVTLFDGQSPQGGRCSAQVLPYLVAPTVFTYLAYKFGKNTYHTVQAIKNFKPVVQDTPLPFALPPDFFAQQGLTANPGVTQNFQGAAIQYTTMSRPALVKSLWVNSLCAIGSLTAAVFFTQGAWANIQALK